MNNIIEISGLEKTYETDSEKLTILKDLDLTVQPGEKIVIVGESGSGKSTLLNILGGIDKITNGYVKAGDFNLDKMDENQMANYRSSFIGLIFQFHYLLKDFTALENVYMPAYIAGMSKKEAEEKAKQLLNDVGIVERQNHLPNQLSGGERQRVAVARSLINDPAIILADEPTGNLDPVNAIMIGDLLFSMVEKYNKTLLLVTHDMKIASKVQTCYTIKNGKLEKVSLENLK